MVCHRFDWHPFNRHNTLRTKSVQEVRYLLYTARHQLDVFPVCPVLLNLPLNLRHLPLRISSSWRHCCLLRKCTHCTKQNEPKVQNSSQGWAKWNWNFPFKEKNNGKFIRKPKTDTNIHLPSGQVIDVNNSSILWPFGKNFTEIVKGEPQRLR